MSTQYMVQMQQQMLEMQQTILNLQRQTSTHQVQMQMGAAVGSGGAKSIEDVLPDEAAREEINMNIALTYEEKEALSNNIQKLPVNKLNHVIEIIQKQMQLTGLQADDEIELEIDQLSTPTLRQLQKYVASALPKKAKSGGQSKKASAGGSKGGGANKNSRAKPAAKRKASPPPQPAARAASSTGGREAKRQRVEEQPPSVSAPAPLPVSATMSAAAPSKAPAATIASWQKEDADIAGEATSSDESEDEDASAPLAFKPTAAQTKVRGVSFFRKRRGTPVHFACASTHSPTPTRYRTSRPRTLPNLSRSLLSPRKQRWPALLLPVKLHQSPKWPWPPALRTTTRKSWRSTRRPGRPDGQALARGRRHPTARQGAMDAQSRSMAPAATGRACARSSISGNSVRSSAKSRSKSYYAQSNSMMSRSTPKPSQPLSGHGRNERRLRLHGGAVSRRSKRPNSGGSLRRAMRSAAGARRRGRRLTSRRTEMLSRISKKSSGCNATTKVDL